MPYTAAHKQETRSRIVHSARRLFNRSGFSDVSIADIMADAGLTHGGFYRHFSGKDDLYEEAVLRFIRQEVPEPWQRAHVSPDARGPALARMILEAYVSDAHFADRDASCPMIALPSDVSRGPRRVKAAFREVLEMMVAAFVGQMKPADRPDRQRALGLVAMLVGAMVLARSVDDPALAGELRASARAEALAAAGWR